MPYILMFLTIVIGFIYYKFIKPRTFKIVKLLPFIIVFGIFSYLDLTHRFNNNRFFKESFHTVIIDCYNYGKAANSNYLLKNKLFIYTMSGEFDLMIGDSVIKTQS